jgi:cytochrome c556
MRNIAKGAFLAAVSAAVVAIGIGGAPVPVSAQDSEAALKDRQATMKSLGKAMETIKAYLDGKAEQPAALESAQHIQSVANIIPEKFPKGTATTDFPGKSGAKPVIWSDWNDFLAKDKGLKEESAKLVDAVKSGDKNTVAAQFVTTGKQACGGCHNTYREKI